MFTATRDLEKRPFTEIPAAPMGKQILDIPQQSLNGMAQRPSQHACSARDRRAFGFGPMRAGARASSPAIRN
jgi:hypothetical protein